MGSVLRLNLLLEGVDLAALSAIRTGCLSIWVVVHLISAFGSIAFYPTFRLAMGCFFVLISSIEFWLLDFSNSIS